MRNSAQGVIHFLPLVLIVGVATLGLLLVAQKKEVKLTPTSILAKPNTNVFGSLSATLTSQTATFNFVYSELNSAYVVDVSTSARMNKNENEGFGSGASSPILVADPQSKWDKYKCGATVYWRVLTADRRHKGQTQSAVVDCVASSTLASPDPFPSPVASPSPPSPSPTPSPRAFFWVRPYLVYPADKSMYPEYETAVKNYMVELQNWYKEKVGATFFMQPLVVVRSKYNYDTMRCDPGPLDSTPPSAECLSDPRRLDGNWGMYMNQAIHDGVEHLDEQTAALVFSAGGGGYAGANLYPNYAGWAIVGDWVLEPISGVVNDWGIPCKYSDGWQCSGGVPKGTPAHELGHAFGLGHPDPVLYAQPSIMKWHGDYPTVGFLQYEVDYLLQSPFFK